MFLVNILKFLSDMSLFGGVILIAGSFLKIKPLFSYIVFAAVCVVYAIMIFIQRKRILRRDTQADLFKRAILITVIVTFFAAILFKFEDLAKYYYPHIITFFGCNFLLVRTLRHDESVYTSLQFQAINLGTTLGIMGIAFFLSSDFVIGNFLKLLKVTYQKILFPIIINLVMGITWLVSRIVNFIAKLLNIDGKINIEPFQWNYADESAEEILGEDLSSPRDFHVLKTLAIILIACVFCLLVFKLLKKLAENRLDRNADSVKISRSYAYSEKRVSESEPIGNDTAGKKRTKYRKYLEAYKRRNHLIENKTTTFDVMMETRKDVRDKESEDAAKAVRNIYMKARYKGDSQPEDLNDMEKSLKILKKAYKESK